MNELVSNPKGAVTEGPYGPWVLITADDGRHLGVAVTPHRCKTLLLIHDVDAPPRTYWSQNLPPTSNPWLRRVSELSNSDPGYHWDTPAYRSLCEQGGLDPDYHRPAFAPENADAGEALVIALHRIDGLSPGTANLFLDIVDYLRVDPWVSEQKDIETIRRDVRFNAEHDPRMMAEVRDFIDRLPMLSRLRLM